MLEEAMYEDDPDPSKGFEKEEMMTDFENARVFRPRLLIHGQAGMGQQYLSGALLHHFEKFHVQLFDMATLQSDPLRVRYLLSSQGNNATALIWMIYSPPKLL